MTLDYIATGRILEPSALVKAPTLVPSLVHASEVGHPQILKLTRFVVKFPNNPSRHQRGNNRSTEDIRQESNKLCVCSVQKNSTGEPRVLNHSRE